jgi:hypothetical protein
MPTRTLERRLGALEALVERYGGDDDGEDFVADIAGETGRYWIDGQLVSQQEWMQRAPKGGFVVDIGEEAGQ